MPSLGTEVPRDSAGGVARWVWYVHVWYVAFAMHIEMVPQKCLAAL